MRIVCLSDTRLRTPAGGVPEGDSLVHAGDLTMGGTEPETEEVLEWLDGLPHEHKQVIAGNHDFLFEGRAPRAREIMATHSALTYLQDSGVTIGDLKFWGTPWRRGTTTEPSTSDEAQRSRPSGTSSHRIPTS